MDIEGTLKERNEQYGHYTMQAGISQTLKKVVWACPNWPKLAADQRESVELILMKLSRILNGNPDYADSWRDIAGYSTLIEKRLNKPPVVD